MSQGGGQDPEGRARSQRALAAHALGKRAEDAACGFLADLGFDILERNIRVGRLEIDVLCRQAELVVVAEVRSRGQGAWVKALDSVDWRKRARIRAAGQGIWRARFARDISAERMRFDIVSVSFDDDGQALIEHISAAF